MPSKQMTGVLLVNLGTPDSFKPKDVFRYLIEFLTDKRVLDFHWLKRQCLVRGLLVPFRYKQSSKQYQQLWTKEGSPLLVHGYAVQRQLQEVLGKEFKVALAMRYRNPSIRSGLEELQAAHVKEIVVFPFFPQYASATTGSVHQKVMDHVKHWQVIPKLTFINSYPTHPALIESFYVRAQQYPLQSYDHILFSFHGLPERQILKLGCLQPCLTSQCCQEIDVKNQFCYKAQCEATARAIAKKLNILPDRYTISFQSRLGKEPWIQPYTLDVIRKGAKQRWKKVLVFCPAFVCDCLETTYEIGHEYRKEFKEKGGEELQLVEGLNSHPTWIQAIQKIVLEQSGSHLKNF